MPFVFDMSEQEYDEENDKFVTPTPDQFVYLAPPKFGGAHEPVDISHYLASRNAQPPAKKSLGFIETLKNILGNSNASTHPNWRPPETPVSRVVIPALVEVGIRRIYCRYDGGQDEGFAWLDFAELDGGNRLSQDNVLELLTGTGLTEDLVNGEFVREPATIAPDKILENIIRYWVCDEWASWLLGRGFGTGEYTMYGAFLVDLENGTIVDDDRAEPIVENIEIDTGK